MTIEERKAREKEQRRNDIINAAEKLFFSKGYDNVSMEDIAKEVELNRATLYLYFKNKETLYLAIVHRAALKLHDLTEERLGAASDLYQKVDALGYSCLYFAQFHPDYFQAYRDFQMGRFDSLDIDPGNEDMKEILELQKNYINKWFDVIALGMSSGVIRRDDADPRLAAVLMMTSFESIAGMRPVFRDALESRGIDTTSFAWGDFRYFLYNLLGVEKFAKMWE